MDIDKNTPYVIPLAHLFTFNSFIIKCKITTATKPQQTAAHRATRRFVPNKAINPAIIIGAI
jgi:hypothetical protein